MDDTTPGFAVIEDAVRLACRAPSLHNSQPWRWVCWGPTLHLFADLTRVMNTADPQGREIHLSCGAALDHLQVAMAAAGWISHVQRFPDSEDPSYLAAIDFRWAPEGVTEDVRRRRLAIERRRTDRRPFDGPARWPDVEVVLRKAVIPHEVMFDIVLDESRASLAQASQLTEAIRANDTSYLTELAWWSSGSAAYDGVPQSSLTSASVSERVDVARSFPTAHGDRLPAHAGVDNSKIIVLSTHNEDARLDVLRCGEALSAVLLEATVAGFATCTLTHMTELAQSREIVRELTGQRGMPQVLIRVGQTSDIDLPATPRKPLADVLEFRAAPSEA